jgi:hypothetical protein
MKILTNHEETLLERRMKRDLEKYTNHLTCCLFFANKKQFNINQFKEQFKQEKSTTIEMANEPLGRILAKTRTYIIIGIDVPK